MPNFKNKLAKMNKNYKKSADEYDSMFTQVPFGSYNATLSSIKLAETKDKKLLHISQQYVITDGPQEGRKVFRNTFLEGNTEEATAKCFAFGRKFLDTMGYEAPENAVDFEDILDEMNGEEIVVRLEVTKNDLNPDFPNITVYPVDVEGADPEEEEEAEEEEEEEENETQLPDDSEEEESEEEEEEDEDEDLRNRAVAFAITWDIEGVDEDSSVDDVVEAITSQVKEEGPWEEDDLEEEEMSLLVDELEIKGAVKKKKKAPKKAAKKSAKKRK